MPRKPKKETNPVALWKWFLTKRDLIQSNDELTAARDRAVDDSRRARDVYDKWNLEDHAAQENRRLRQALTMAEEENARLYRIIAELRIERANVQKTQEGV